MGSPIFRWKLDTAKKLAVITFLSNLYFYNHVGTLYQQTRGLDLLQVSSIWSIIVGTIVLAEVPTGILADKIGRKWSVSIALLIQALGEFLYFFATGYVSFVLIAVLAGIGYAFLSGANEALLYDSLTGKNKDKQMTKASGFIGSAYHLAFFLAPILGGLIVSQLILSNFLLAILLTAFSVTLAFMVSLTIKEPKKPYTHEEQSPLQILKQGAGQLRNRQLQRVILFGIFASTYGATLFTFFQPYFVENKLSAKTIALALATGNLLAIYVQKNAYRLQDKLGLRLALLTSSLTTAGFYLLLASLKLYALVPVFILANATIDIRSPLMAAYQNSFISSKNRATTLSLINMLNRFYEAIMGLVWGWLATYSIGNTFYAIGGLIVISTLLLLPKNFRRFSPARQ